VKTGELTWRDFVPEAERVVRSMGLDPKPTLFEEVTPREINRIVAQHVPWAPPHWSRGRDAMIYNGEYERGESQVYEVVYDMGDHAIAYISTGGSQAERTLTVPHVYGHSHVFAHNIFQSRVGDLWTRYRQAFQRYAVYEEAHGYEALEEWIDLAQALAPNVSPDPPLAFGDHTSPGYYEVHDFRSQPVDYQFPRERSYAERTHRALRSLGIGEHDILRWLIEHAPLEDWQRDVLAIERDIALYWKLRARTKILHEGFATWTHIHALRQMSLPPSWVMEIASAHARVSAVRASNPYWFGLQAIFYLAETLGPRGMIQRIANLSDHSLVHSLLDEPGWYHRLYEESDGGYLLWQDKIGYESFVAQMRRFLSERLLPGLVGESFRVYVGHPGELTPLGIVPDADYVMICVFSGAAHVELCLTSEVPLDTSYATRVAQMISNITGLTVRVYHPGDG